MKWRQFVKLAAVCGKDISQCLERTFGVCNPIEVLAIRSKSRESRVNEFLSLSRSRLYRLKSGQRVLRLDEALEILCGLEKEYAQFIKLLGEAERSSVQSSSGAAAQNP